MNRISLTLVAVLGLTLSGCSVDPFCITCQEPDAGRRPMEQDGGAGEGDGGVLMDSGIVMRFDGSLPDGQLPDGQLPDGCLAFEECNELDDDCDGKIDEDFDLDRHLDNCGACGQACAPVNAFGKCEEGECSVDFCDVGYYDLNGDPDDGCEYGSCLPIDDNDDLCNRKDDDCDGEIDEDVAFDTDPFNCGECGTVCATPHATSSCDGGSCAFSACMPGFWDEDGQLENGCEYDCVARDPAVEVCNVRDDDCDGTVDEGDPEGGGPCGASAGTGLCTAGVEHCLAGQIQCIGGIRPTTELCNGQDDNCDGQDDEGGAFGAEGGRLCCVDTGDLDGDGDTNCNLGVGRCANGRETCVTGAFVCTGSTGPKVETCDGFDEDCDGTVDEDPTNLDLSGNSFGADGGDDCGTDVGECAFGKKYCVNGVLKCKNAVVAASETCNDKDDDCDGNTDEDPNNLDANDESFGADGGGLCCTDAADLDGDGDNDCNQDVGQCVDGRKYCVAGLFECRNSIGPSVELCNALDEDCDGMTDEGNPGGGTLCGNSDGECKQGQEVCEGGIYVCKNFTGPKDEMCNGKDDDCDTKFDEGLPFGADSGRVCGMTDVGQCKRGHEECEGGALVCKDFINPLAVELCNALDDDCDNNIDEGAPTNGACGTAVGVCPQGTSTCQGGIYVCKPNLPLPSAETCDGLDNDCDTKTDEGVPFGAGGGALCCEDPLDLDGDGDTDCNLGVGQCVPGREQCEGAGLVCKNGDGTPFSTGPRPEACDGLDNDCDSKIDEGVTTAGPCGTAVGVCPQGTSTCQGGTYVCVPNAPFASAEKCDMLDNDCDSQVDEGSTPAGAEGGKLCGSSVGVCTPGTQTCTNGSLQCVGAFAGGVEQCDGLDNNCDGNIDEGNPEGGGTCGTAVGECATGTEVCSGGVLTCPNDVQPTSELCDGLDNDCDGLTDENNPQSGGICGTDVGRCATGTQQCVGGGLVCMGNTTPIAETCNSLDDDCDGNTDEGGTYGADGGALCGNGTGVCTQGHQTCQGGALACVGGIQPTVELCDGLNNDCDAMTDEDFDTNADVNNCGGCNIVCSVPNAVAGCNGMCQVANCLDGFFDLDGSVLNGCEYSCSFAGSEVCNGADDDCDNNTDEGLTIPQNICDKDGVCSGTNASCGGGAGWVCNYPAGTYQVTENRCDYLDNDCDGQADEQEPLRDDACYKVRKIGDVPEVKSLSGTPVIDSCDTLGVYACTMDGTGVYCNAADPAAPADEDCDNEDNDCDGKVDERVADIMVTPYRDGVDLAAISTVTVTRPNASTFQIMQFEASHADASDTDAGNVGGFACSAPGMLPWTNVTWPEANNACCGLNPGGGCPGAGQVGWRLCGAADWEIACEGPAGSCDWSYGNGQSCTVSAPLTCNGNEYDSNPAQSGDQDSLMTTGDSQFPMCGTTWPGGSVYDLSGNAKEWTSTAVGSGVYGIRGGSYTNIEPGRTCDFDFVAAAETFSHINTGFRCCYY